MKISPVPATIPSCNFALLADLNHQHVHEWYWVAYVDAHEWVVAPNVLGMALTPTATS